MKRYSKITFGTALSILMASCGNFQIPESVSIRTDAKFQVPLGTAAYDLTQTISPSSMRKQVQDSMGAGVTVYDYISPENPDTLNYLVRYPGMTVPVDVGTYLENMNMGDALGNMSQDFSIKAGSPINYTKTQSIPFPDFSDKLKQSPDASANIDSFSEGIHSSIDESLLPTISITGGSGDISYSRIYYSDGAIQIDFKKTDSTAFSPDYKMNILAKLCAGDDTVIAQSNNGSFQDVTKNSVLVIPLTTSLGIPNNFKIKFAGNTSGGTSAVSHNFKITGEFSNIMPSKVTGVNASNMAALGLGANDLDQSYDIDFGSSLPDAIKSVEFDDAKLKIKISNPDGWSGVSLNLPASDGLSFEGPTTTSLTSSPVADGNLINTTYTWGAQINPKTTPTIKAKIHPTLSLNNATIILKNGSTNFSINCEIGLSLTKLKSAVVNLESLGASSISIPTDGSTGSIELPQDLLKFVNGIKFNSKKTDASGVETEIPREGFGLKCTVTNTLPAGNDIGLTLQAFDKQGASGYYFDKDVVIPSGSTNKSVSWTDYPDIRFPAYSEGQKKYLPFNVIIKDASNFTMKNIELGTDYKMKISLDKLVYDWDSVSLNLSNVKYSGDMNIDFSISSLLQDFSIANDMIKNVGLHTFPMYIFAEKASASSIFSGMSLEGQMYVSYKENNVQKYIDVLNNGAPIKPVLFKNMNIVDAVKWPADPSVEIRGNASDPSNIAYYLTDARASAKAELKDILSLTSVSDMSLQYQIQMAGTNQTVYASALASGEPEELTVEYAMLLSFDFELKAPIKVNIMEFADENYNTPDASGKYSDILQRENASSFEQFADYMDSIDYVGLAYTVNNKLITNLDLEARVVDTHGATGLDKTIEFTQGRHENKFTKDEIKSIMTKYPFHPDIDIQMGRDLSATEKLTGKYAEAQRFAISRSGASSPDALSSQIIVVVKMDGQTPISVWQKN